MIFESISISNIVQRITPEIKLWIFLVGGFSNLRILQMSSSLTLLEDKDSNFCANNSSRVFKYSFKMSVIMGFFLIVFFYFFFLYN